MKKKRKHKKQQGATHPISERTRVLNIMEIGPVPEKPTLKLEYDETLRILTPSEAKKTPTVRLIKEDVHF